MLLLCVLMMPVALAAPALAETAARKEVVDPVGRRVSVPARLQRIVSLAPSVTEILYALQQEHRLVGVTRFSNYPPQAQKLPRVGSYVHLNVEQIAALQPDLCIAVKDGNPITVVEQLQSIGLPVYAVNPLDLASVMDSIQAIGTLLDAEARAGSIIDDMHQRIARVKERVARAESRPTLFFQIGISPIVSVGTDTFINTLITMAGGTNVAAGSPPYPRFSREQVIAKAPEVMVISSMARDAVFEQVKREWMQWPAIPAVKNDKVFIAPPDMFDRPSPRLVDALELLAAYLHPALFKDVP